MPCMVEETDFIMHNSPDQLTALFLLTVCHISFGGFPGVFSLSVNLINFLTVFPELLSYLLFHYFLHSFPERTLLKDIIFNLCM